MFLKYILCSLLLSWAGGSVAEFSQQQLDWLDSEDEHPAQVVNEGRLIFIAARADEPEHHQTMQIKLTEDTITSGWAVVTQCHVNLDRVERLEVLFRQGRVRNLQVVEYRNIRSAEVNGHRVEVQGIMADSRICLRSESRVLWPVGKAADAQAYEMTNGPFMRRFLDGFYPISIAMEVHYPVDRLQLQSVLPVAQPGWEIRYDADRIFLNGRFEGKLVTKLRFTPVR